ncbi:hypothetical protein [Clostridium sp. YIM B02555]|uniref:hypothetical protein n=1 Tax=Clostridium sp. YIM B02555 TaxID=2911968 RepID=UPI001EEDF13F|nr:hypothetical protein [Clostridium sp. YIM B02555]
MITKRTDLYILKIVIVSIVFVLLSYTTGTVTKAADNYETVILTGYIIDEHCFIKEKDDPGKDKKMCKLMDGCIKGGYGIAVKQSDGSYNFYYFNGKFFTDTKALDGTEGQKLAYDLIKASKKEDHMAVTVTGAFSGETKGSVGGEQGVEYKVLDVISLKEATDEEAANLQKAASTDAPEKDSAILSKTINTNALNSKMSEDNKCGDCISIKYIGIILGSIVVLGVVVILILKRFRKAK